MTSSAPNEPTRSLLEVSAAVGECRIRDFSHSCKALVQTCKRDNAESRTYTISSTKYRGRRLDSA
ncbi:hypothetical protein [Helicobacter cinaedi]|uniref:hypothetical protein n=1 Tax=Helicobacter cinaedi TaxID=213 RepID=UPI00138AE5B4|nr:hypothetical protein [Helicobacter cinaedi]QOQ95644.1 hypothetical protein HW245_08480 [Helicobacter cinaedi]